MTQLNVKTYTVFIRSHNEPNEGTWIESFTVKDGINNAQEACKKAFAALRESWDLPEEESPDDYLFCVIEGDAVIAYVDVCF